MDRTDYRFTLTRDTDTFEVTPMGFYAGGFDYIKTEGQLFFRRELKSELIFTGSDYTYIYNRYLLGNYCDIYELLIEKYNKSTQLYEVDWIGYFSMTDGKFNFEKCDFRVVPTIEDKYSCLDRNKDVEVNILKVAPSDIGSYIKSVLEFEIQYSGSTTPPSTTNTGMVHMTYRLRSAAPLTYCHIFAREAVLLENSITPSGVGWSQITSNSENNVIEQLQFNDEFKKWGRSWVDAGVSAPAAGDIVLNFDTVNADCSITEVSPGTGYLKFMTGRYRCPGALDSVSKHSLWISKTIYDGALWTQSTIYRARNLIYCLQYILNQNCTEELTIVSDFLTNNTNPVTGMSSKTNHLYLIQKSDAKRPNASNPATIGNMTFQSFMNMLYTCFQLYWYIDDLGNFVIKHKSEISSVAGLDITVNSYLKTTAHKKEVEFNKELLYRFEQWQFMEVGGDDFKGLPIEYNELCTIKESTAKTKQYTADNVTTDLAYVQTNTDKIGDEGFVLISTDDSDILFEIGEISGANNLNGHLAISNLHPKYWLYNRIFSTGYMNGINTSFMSPQKIQKLPELNITLCDEFDPLDYIVTELGNAEVNEAQFSPLNNRLTLRLSI